MAAVVPGGERQREMAFRFGVNWVMHARPATTRPTRFMCRPLSTGWVNNMLSITFAPMFDWIFLGVFGVAVVSLPA